MTTLDDNILLVPVRDSRLDFQDKYAFQVRSGGTDHSFRFFSSTSSSNNGLTFLINPPNDLVATSRQLYINLKAQIVITGVSTAVGQQMVRIGHDGLRQFPLSAITDNISLTLNGQKMNIQLARQVHALSKYFQNDIEASNTFLSASPCAPDNSQYYEDLTPSNRNPLNPFASSEIGGYQGRFSGMKVISNSLSTAIGQTLTAVVDIDVIEPVFMNPFQWKHAESSFVHLNTMDINLTFLSTWANRIFSHATDNGGVNIVPNSITGTISNDCQAFVEFITVPEIQSIPKVIKYNYSEINPYITTPAPFAPFESRLIQSNQIQMGVVPRNIYIWVRNNFQSLTQNCQQTDTYFAIETVKLFWNNKDSIFSSASPVQLYQIACEHGYNVSYREHTGYPMVNAYRSDLPGLVVAESAIYPCGSVLCFEFGRDIPCDSMTAPGSVGNYQLSAQITCKNLRNEVVAPELYISTCVDGILSLAMAYGRINSAIMTPSDVFSTLDGGEYLTTNELSGVQGGDFWQSLKNTGADILKFMAPVDKFLRKTKLLSTAGLVANTLGVPIPGLALATRAVDRLGYGMGGVRTGGASISRKTLKNMSDKIMY